MIRRTINSILCFWVLLMPLAAQDWRAHLAYNNVTQIAMSPDHIYAVADGSLFSVDKQTEKIQTYDGLSGLHGTNIVCIYYDDATDQLLIAYRSGKIDLLSSRGVQYIGGLYDKDMTQRKDIYNVTVVGHTAYLATHYGVQTFDFETSTLVDSYWLRPGGEETPIKDVVLSADSIYAIGNDTLYCAALADNLVDYHVWNCEPHSTRIQPDTDKGKHYSDGVAEWSVGGTAGVIRDSEIDGRTTYKPNCPLTNIPYRIRYGAGKIGVVQGGYEAGFFHRSGVVMTYADRHWQNFDYAYTKAATGLTKLEDISDIAIDPEDPEHFFVSSFGYGLLEFRNNAFYKHYTPENSDIEPCVAGRSYPYLWVDGMVFDADGNLWMLNNSMAGVKVLMKDGTWKGFENDATRDLGRTKTLLISNTDPNIKMLTNRPGGIGVFDDNGTLDDPSDDRAVYLSTYITESGSEQVMPIVHTIYQTSDGALWVGTDSRLLRFENPEQLLNGDKSCRIVALDENGGDCWIRSVAEDDYGRVWVGTEHDGIFCLASDQTQVLFHLTTTNSPILSNNIQSLCVIPHEERMFIGTGEGLMELHYTSPDDPQGIYWSEEKTTTVGSMKNWKTHFSFNTITSIEDAGDNMYCISDGELLLVNKSSDETQALSKLTGLNGSDVALVCYNTKTRKTLILYRNGMMDIIEADGEVKNMLDVFLTTEKSPAEFYSATSYDDRVYICSSLGIINLNIRKNEVAETYVLLNGDDEVTTHHVSIIGDSIYAGTDKKIYAAPLQANLIDYSVWKPITTPFRTSIKSLCSKNSYLYVLTSDSAVYARHESQWTRLLQERKSVALYAHPQSILVQTTNGVCELDGTESSETNVPYWPKDILHTNNSYWLAVDEQGLLRWNSSEGTQKFAINSPYVNLSYRLRATRDKLIMLPGGYFAAVYARPGTVMMYENDLWNNYTYHELQNETGMVFYDLCDAAIDPNDPSHFFVSSFGYGLLEFRNNAFYKHYTSENSGIEPVVQGRSFPYLWVDGLMFDADGNLWMLNNSMAGVKVLQKNSTWLSFENDATRDLNRTKDLLIWNRNPNIKITTCARSTPGIGVFDDNGTLSNQRDDRAVFIGSFVDQNEKTVSPQYVYSICQMANGEVWVGTEHGIIVIPDVRKLLNGDKHCRRIIIPRNDGTGLGDYLLGDEMINAIVEDAAGRKWIGTETSGLYLVSSDGLETIEHFTMDNSPLVSNGIYSLVIQPRTGEVFIGTSIGLLSYQSDANEAKEDMSNVYAYPNPVPPSYTGYISITGLMDNTAVNIIDAGGNLVCKTRSNGGLAVWDGKDAYGRPVNPGIYTAMCNAEGGHTVCKILVMHETR